MESNIVNLFSEVKNKNSHDIITNVIHHLEMNGFTYKELEEWVQTFVVKYNEMMERKYNKLHKEEHYKKLLARFNEIKNNISEQCKQLEAIAEEFKEYES